MLDIIKSLGRTFVLLICSVIQVMEAIFAGVGLIFCGVANALKAASNWLMNKLVRGKYEHKMRSIIE